MPGTTLRADGTIVVERLAYSPLEAAAALGCTRQLLDKLARKGELRTTKLGRAVRIPASEVRRLAGELPEVSP